MILKIFIAIIATRGNAAILQWNTYYNKRYGIIQLIADVYYLSRQAYNIAYHIRSYVTVFLHICDIIDM